MEYIHGNTDQAMSTLNFTDVLVHSDVDSKELNVDAVLTQMMGAKRRDWPSVAVLTFVYVLIFFTGVSGNVCTCIVIARNSYMQTATNYYLFSLAVSDMLTLVFGLPTELYGIWESYPWRFGESLCIFKSFLAEMTSYASVLTITAFTVERYIAICHPIKAQTLSNLSRAIKIVFIVWILSCIFALPYPIHTRVFPYVVINGTAIQDSLQCNIPFEWQARMKAAFQISTFLFFVFPMGVISVMYGIIGYQLRRSELDSKHKSKTRARRAVVRMLVAVVVAFFVQWAPFHAQRLLTLYIPTEDWTPALIQFQSDLFYVSGVLYFCNSTINPILYNSMSKKFRLAFKRTLCRCCYTSDELLELNGKSKSIYCSVHSVRQTTNNITKMSTVGTPRMKHQGTILKPEMSRGTSSIMTGSKTPRCLCNQQHSPVRHSDSDRCPSSQNGGRGGPPNNGFSPRAAGLRYVSSTNSSLVSLGDLETDSVVEMKSLSTGSCSNLLNSTHLTVPVNSYNVKRGGSFV